MKTDHQSGKAARLIGSRGETVWRQESQRSQQELQIKDSLVGKKNHSGADGTKTDHQNGKAASSTDGGVETI